jgi:hypothetical protein
LVDALDELQDGGDALLRRRRRLVDLREELLRTTEEASIASVVLVASVVVVEGIRLGETLSLRLCSLRLDKGVDGSVVLVEMLRFMLDDRRLHVVEEERRDLGDSLRRRLDCLDDRSLLGVMGSVASVVLVEVEARRLTLEDRRLLEHLRLLEDRRCGLLDDFLPCRFPFRTIS